MKYETNYQLLKLGFIFRIIQPGGAFIVFEVKEYFTVI
jgi:hypothetical protein